MSTLSKPWCDSSLARFDVLTFIRGYTVFNTQYQATMIVACEGVVHAAATLLWSCQFRCHDMSCTQRFHVVYCHSPASGVHQQFKLVHLGINVLHKMADEVDQLLLIELLAVEVRDQK